MGRAVRPAGWNAGYDKLIPATEETAKRHAIQLLMATSIRDMDKPVKLPALMVAFELAKLVEKHRMTFFYMRRPDGPITP